LFKVVIPARYDSTRLPGKALRPIAGKPMLQWVCEIALSAQAEEVWIATDDERIAERARSFAGERTARVAMTSRTHASGTDRVAELARTQGWDERQIVVNVQGDEPLLPPELIRQAAGILERFPEADIATLATPVESAADFLDPNIVKVIADVNQRVLYFSRPRVTLASARAFRARAATSVCMPTGPVPCSAWRPCRSPRWSAVKSSSSCGPWKPDSTSAFRMRSARPARTSTPSRTWRAWRN
jgi:3-deoxy-D-manno-octulosonate cytidylyltransferase